MINGECYMNCNISYVHPNFSIDRDIKINWGDLKDIDKLGKKIALEILDVLGEGEDLETCQSN